MMYPARSVKGSPLRSFVTGSQLSVAVPLIGGDDDGDAGVADGGPVVVGAPPQAAKNIITTKRSKTAVACRNMSGSGAATAELICSLTWKSPNSVRCPQCGKKVADVVPIRTTDATGVPKESALAFESRDATVRVERCLELIGEYPTQRATV